MKLQEALNKELIFKKALEDILKLDPSKDSSEDNEWAEAECFSKAQEIAKKALR
jgi:hypothetical protein